MQSLKRVFVGMFIAGGIFTFLGTYNGADICRDLSTCVGAVGLYDLSFSNSQSTPVDGPFSDGSNWAQTTGINLIVVSLAGLAMLSLMHNTKRPTKRKKLRRA